MSEPTTETLNELRSKVTRLVCNYKHSTTLDAWDEPCKSCVKQIKKLFKETLHEEQSKD